MFTGQDTDTVILLGVTEEQAEQAFSHQQTKMHHIVVDEQQRLLHYLEQHRTQICTILLGLDVVEPIRVAQCVYTISSHIPIFILVEPEHYEHMLQTIRFSPFLSSDTTLWSTENMHELAKAIDERVRRAHNYRKYQATMNISQSRVSDIIPNDRTRQVTHYIGRVLDNVPFGIINIDIQGKILGMNRQAGQILHRTEREALGLKLNSFFSEEEGEQLTNLVARCVAPIRPSTPTVIDFSESSGSEQYLEVVVSPLVDRSGQLGATLILRNVTVRILSEKKRKEAEEALRLSERRYRELIQTMSEGVVLTDTQLAITYVNDSFCRMLNYNSTEIVGLPLTDFIVEENRNLVLPQLSNTAEPGIKRYEVTWITQDKQHLTTLASQKKIIDPVLGYVGCLGVFTDITERKQAESNQKKHMLELAHMSRVTTLGEMSSQIAHELAQPLSAIAGLSTACLKLFQNGKAVTEDIEEALASISEQSRRAREIVIRLKNFVRNEEVQYTSIQLNDLIQAVLHFIEVEARWHNLPLKLEMTEGLLPVMGDKVLLEQVVLNLVHNAIEALQTVPANQRSIIIRTEMTDNNRASVAVIDSGPGITPALKEKIFSPFFTTKSNGMGMGLAITKSIIKAHDGSLTVDNNIASPGCTFQVYLPLARQ